ncbi:MAG TPA: hypothetical protein VN706_08500 [Gemmatimonadaceae bacterium]|nr:hypothetical protein [Gemmatimonadaceae bacterium]
MANAVFSCPKCGKILGDIPPQGLLTAVCADCRLKYQVVRGRVTAAEATVSVIRRAAGYSAAVSEWSYMIRLSLTSGRIEVLEFTLIEPDTFAAQAGDIVSAIYLMRADDRESLLSVHNGTLGERIVIARPGEKATRKAWLFAGGVGIAAFAIFGGLAGGLLGIGVGAFAFVGAGVTLGHKFMPSVNVSDDERARLTAVQQMLAEKLELEESLARIGQGMDSRAELRAKLVSLRTKMQRLGLEVYAPRIASMTAGIAAIDQQLELEARLRDAYERSIAMLEIELEAGAAVDAMEGMDAPHIAATFAEMRELEEQQKELTQQITANAEVEGLLRGS